MERPLVSIVIPTYNRARLLPGALDSCLSQTYENFELLVVDDGSSDGTPEVIRRYEELDKRVRYIRQPNGGASNALNNGFAQTRGAYITWTSDDNYFKPDAVQEMVGLLTAHPEVDLVYADYELIDQDGHVLRQVTTPDSLAAEFPLPGPCFLYKREVYERAGGYSEKLKYSPDLEYFARLFPRFRMKRLPLNVYRFAMHAESATTQGYTQLLIENAEVLGRHAANAAERRQVRAYWIVRAAENEVKLGHGRRAAWLATRGLLARPSGWRRIGRIVYGISPRWVKSGFRLLRRTFVDGAQTKKL